MSTEEKARYRVPAVSQRVAMPEVVKQSGYQTLEGWVSADWGWNYWQQGYDPIPTGASSVVEACIAAYAQTIAMCPGSHWELLPNGGRKRVETSALSRILRKPNSYQTISDFVLNLTDSLYDDGNAYALALRNDRFEISELHLMDPRQCGPRVAITGDIFYYLGGNEIVERAFGDRSGLLQYVPARDVLHVKLKTRRDDPLKGESPMLSAALDEAASSAMARQAVSFYMNQSRPSGVLQTPEKMTKDQVEELRQRWYEHSRGLNAGGTPILTRGLEWKPMRETAQQAQLAEIMGYTDKRIAAVFRVPLILLNLEGEGPKGSTEAVMQFWIATGLGFAINHIEEAFGQMFGLFGLPHEYLEFDTAALLRSEFKDRIEGWTRGVQGGVFSPNEARNEFEYPSVEHGDEPRVQQQVVPLSFGAQMQPPAPAAIVPPQDDTGDSPDVEEDDDRDWTDLILAAAERYDDRVAT